MSGTGEYGTISGKRRRGFAVGNRDADDLTARLGQLVDLREGCSRVARIGGRHRLHDDGIVATDFDIANVENAGLAARCDEHGR